MAEKTIAWMEIHAPDVVEKEVAFCRQVSESFVQKAEQIV